MRFLFRWTFRIFLILVVLVVGLVLLKDALLKSLLEQRIRSRTGLDVKIGRFDMGVFSPTMTIENVKLYNTAEFGGSPLIDLPELHLECDAGALARQQLRFKLVRLDLAEVNVVESKEGRTNIVAMLGMVETLASTNARPRVARTFEFAGIDTLNLTLGTIHYTSLKRPGKDATFQLGLKNEIVTDVESFAELHEHILTLLVNRGVTFVSGPPNPAAARETQSPAAQNTRPKPVPRKP